MGSNKYYKEDGTFDTDKFYDEVARMKAAGGDQNEIGTEANLRKLATEALSMNYDDFTKGNDYASLAKRYSQQGQKAMDDTIGKVAARTGGLASSYATAAGNQAYNDWMGNLEEAARYLYDSQKQEKMNAYSIAQGIYDRNVANDQWQKQFDATQEQNRIDNQYREKVYDDSQSQTLVDDEKTDLYNELYYNANAYPSYADYKEAFPNSLLSEADFKQIKNQATGKYAEDNKATVTSQNEKKKEDEENKLYQEFYNNPNSYASYIDFKRRFPNTLISESEFEQIKNLATGDYKADNKGNTEAKAYETVALMLASGVPLEQILQQNYQLINDTGYDTGYWTAYEKDIQPVEEEASDFTRYIYTGTEDEFGNNVFQYGAGGKTFSFAKGVNPYTGSTNPDVKNGTFKNGYQPNNINGEKLTKTGITDVINGVTQNVWKTPDGRKWIWDGTRNEYLVYYDPDDNEVDEEES